MHIATVYPCMEACIFVLYQRAAVYFQLVTQCYGFGGKTALT